MYHLIKSTNQEGYLIDSIYFCLFVWLLTEFFKIRARVGWKYLPGVELDPTGKWLTFFLIGILEVFFALEAEAKLEISFHIFTKLFNWNKKNWEASS